MAFAKQHEVRAFLIDHLMAEFGLNIIEMYYRPQKAEEMGVKRYIPVALILDFKYEKDFSFGETVFVNRGFQYKVFQTREEGELWLAEFLKK